MMARPNHYVYPVMRVQTQNFAQFWKPHFKDSDRDFPGDPVARLSTPNAGDPGSIPSQETISYMPQPRPGIVK